MSSPPARIVRKPIGIPAVKMEFSEERWKQLFDDSYTACKARVDASWERSFKVGAASTVVTARTASTTLPALNVATPSKAYRREKIDSAATPPVGTAKEAVSPLPTELPRSGLWRPLEESESPSRSMFSCVSSTPVHTPKLGVPVVSLAAGSAWSSALRDMTNCVNSSTPLASSAKRPIVPQVTNVGPGEATEVI